MMKVFLLDDEPLAIKRLSRMLEETRRVEIVGTSSDPTAALSHVRELSPDVLFLDIEMPGLSGFDFLERLAAPQPLVVFTTAYDRYALEAFKANSIDYLLKPVQPDELDRALSKLQRMLGNNEPRTDVARLLDQMRAMVANAGASVKQEYLTRVASRVGDRVELVEVSQVTHFYAQDKLTFAATPAKHYALDQTVTDIERRLPPNRWIRIHRSTLLNMDAVKELYTWFGGKLRVRLKDGKTELEIARDRAADVKLKLGL